MAELNHFRTFEISQDGGGNAFELSRSDERVVCLAFDARFGCFCEIAALTQTAEEGSTPMEEFLEQASTVAGTHHRGLATLLDYGDDQGVRFYAVEFIDGERLAEYGKRVNGLPAALAFGICADLAEALGAISVLAMPIAAGNARVTLDDRGRLRVRIVDYPLGMLHPEGPRDAAAGIFELAHLLGELAAGETIGEKGRGAEAVEGVVQQLRSLNSIHDAALLLREAAGGEGFIAVEARHRPKLMLAEKLFSHGSPDDFLSDDYRVEHVSAAAADPYSISVVRVSESRPLRMHVLPPPYILSDEGLPIYETEKSPSVVGAEALWRSEHFRLVSEDRFPGFSLSALLRQAGELSDMEVMMLLDHVETAILEARAAGAELTKVQPDNVLLKFDGWDFDEVESLIKKRPMTTWPEFSVVLRAHQTMRGLTTLTPNAKQRFVQMRAQLEHGEPICNLAVLELYLQLHDSGRAEQAEELLDRFEQSCKASMAAAAAEVVEEPVPVYDEAVDLDLAFEDEEEDEVLSPIAVSVVEEQVEDVEHPAEVEPVALVDVEVEAVAEVGGMFGDPMAFDDLVDGEYADDYFDEEGSDEEDSEPVVSPIAVAMGVVEEEGFDFDDLPEEAGIGLGVGAHEADEDFDEDDDWWDRGEGLGEHGQSYEDGDEDDSPFGLNPLPGDESLPELDLEGVSAAGSVMSMIAGDRGDLVRGIIIFVILTLVLSGLGALIVHFVGR